MDMNLNPYLPSTIATAYRPTPSANRNLWTNLVGIAVVILFWFLFLRAIDDRFFGALVLGAACGLILDGLLIGFHRILTAIVLVTVPFVIALPLSLHVWTFEPGDTFGLVLISSIIFWIESIVPVAVMCVASIMTHRILR